MSKKIKVLITIAFDDSIKGHEEVILKNVNDALVDQVGGAGLAPDADGDYEGTTTNGWRIESDAGYVGENKFPFMYNLQFNKVQVDGMWPLLTRNEFMEYFRSEKYSEELSVDDCNEIFIGCLKGSSDIETPDLFQAVANEYCLGKTVVYLEDATDEALRQELRRRGYATAPGSLWRGEDVTNTLPHFEGEEAIALMERVLVLGSITETIHEQISILADEEDLFQKIGELPQEVQDILDEYRDEEGYVLLEELQEKLFSMGYTFEWGLEGEPYHLRKI
jgi:hypothetical protein